MGGAAFRPSHWKCQGRGVFGFSTTPEGKRPRIYAYVDCFGCPSAPDAWRRLIGVAPQAPNGSFALALTPARQGLRYRISVPGPQLGTTYAPDASAQPCVISSRL